jgi:hypothetical protein
MHSGQEGSLAICVTPDKTFGDVFVAILNKKLTTSTQNYVGRAPPVVHLNVARSTINFLKETTKPLIVSSM